MNPFASDGGYLALSEVQCCSSAYRASSGLHMIQSRTYVHENEHGLRVGGCDISLDSVVINYQKGLSAESIQQHFPALSLEEVYGAIAFYLGNRKEVEEYLQRQEEAWAELKRRCDENPSPVVARLRALAANSATPTT